MLFDAARDMGVVLDAAFVQLGPGRVPYEFMVRSLAPFWRYRRKFMVDLSNVSRLATPNPIPLHPDGARRVLEVLSAEGVLPGHYDAVISWVDDLVPVADVVAQWLQLPASRAYLRDAHVTRGLPGNKVLARTMMRNASSGGSISFALVHSVAEAMAAGERIGFPAFMKPAVGEGMSASLSQGLLSGELHNASQLELAARFRHPALPSTCYSHT